MHKIIPSTAGKRPLQPGIRRILVVSVLKTTTSRHNISSGSRLLRSKIKLALVSTVHRISHQQGSLTSCNTGLKVILAHRSSPASSGPALAGSSNQALSDVVPQVDFASPSKEKPLRMEHSFFRLVR